MRRLAFFTFLQDHEGKYSSTRVKTSALLILAIAVIAYQVVNDTVDHVLIGELLGLSFGYEAYKKDLEIKSKKINTVDQANGKDTKGNI